MLAVHVDEWTPELRRRDCVDAAEIERLAVAYGTIRPSAIRTLIGAEHHENGAMFFRTLACLPALVGAWKDRGGGLARSIGVWTGSLIDGAAHHPGEGAGSRRMHTGIWVLRESLYMKFVDDCIRFRTRRNVP